MPRVRPAAGFTIDFAYGLPETNEFIWAVSAEGDEEAFLAREREYMASDARAEVFVDVPQRVAEHDIRFVGDTSPDAGQPPRAPRIARATSAMRAAICSSECGSAR